MRIWLFFFISLSSPAAEVSETFLSRANLASGTAVWNQALGKVHPSLQLVNFKPGFTPLAIEVSNGTHGAFELATYAQFSVGGDLSGNIIRLDTTTYPILKVTRFFLAAGWFLIPVGQAPLVIHSLSDILINGEIWCQGIDGVAAVGTTPGTGGAGRCGGASGGSGGAPFANGSDGSNVAAPVTGGQGGLHTGGLAVGGGGGGAFGTTTAPGDGPNSSVPNRGLRGVSLSEPEFNTVAGGAGGGGGSGTAVSAGAGGGGGGGLVVLHAVRDFEIGAAGYIFAAGGEGGSSNANGGPGGGGGGGGVKVFVGRKMNFFNIDVDGGSQAERSLGGTNSLAVVGAVGASGRSWFSSVIYNDVGTGYYLPSEEAPVIPGSNVEFVSSAQSVITQSIDLNQTLATIDGLNLSPTSPDFLFEAAGSKDDFVSDDTGFTSNLIALGAKRYVKFKITITSASPTNPTMVDTATFVYTPVARQEFKLEASGCAHVDTGGSTGGAGPLAVLFAIFLLLKFKTQLSSPVRR